MQSNNLGLGLVRVSSRVMVRSRVKVRRVSIMVSRVVTVSETDTET